MVSIHALLAECDPLDAPGRRVKVVSIHALLAECDMMMPLSPHQETSFNPRTPCGVRQSSGANGRDSTMFQSTHSLRSATWKPRPVGNAEQFQSTHSLRSATYGIRGLKMFHMVSIHALLAECDVNPRNNKTITIGFNPRTPCGVRRPVAYTQVARTGVSIHALLAECDQYGCISHRFRCSFNPRTPCGVRQ